MKYVHSALVIHRDLKPRNLLVNSQCDLKICDFGLARVRFSEDTFNTCPMTEYVCTRWYRAPEVLCSWMRYTSAIDVWSIGCIFAEMLLRKPLFPGGNTPNQVELIISFLGTRPPEELRRIPNEKCRLFITKMEHKDGQCMKEKFPGVDDLSIDLLDKTLQFDPDNRITVIDGLAHELLEDLSCPRDEPSRVPVETDDFEFERRRLNMTALREELFLEAMVYYPHKYKKFLAQQEQHGLTVHDIKNYRLLQSGEEQYSSDDEVDDPLEEGDMYDDQPARANHSKKPS